MDASQKLIQAIASLLWPLIVVVLVFLFRPVVAAIAESAKSRKFTLKIGGQELTMEEANQAQQNLIADLQSKVSEIEKRLAEKDGKAGQKRLESTIESSPRVSRVLWVDDNPKNNSFFIQQLSELGIKVDLARSTSDAITRFSSREYQYVISDMGRQERGVNNERAGIDLLKLLREKDAQIPFVIYCSTRGQRLYGNEALKLGATAVTSSPTELAGILNLHGATGHS